MKAYHPRIWCKQKFLKQTQALFHAKTDDDDDTEEEDDAVSEDQKSLN